MSSFLSFLLWLLYFSVSAENLKGEIYYFSAIPRAKGTKVYKLGRVWDKTSVRPLATEVGRQGSQCFQFIELTVSVPHIYRQRAIEGHPSGKPLLSIAAVVSKRTFLEIFAIFCVPLVL